MSNARNLAAVISGNYSIPAEAIANISATNITSGTLSPARIAVGDISTDKIADGAIHTIKLADGAVHTVKMADGSVTSAKIEENVALQGTGSITVPKGTAAQRGTSVAGKFRYNTDLNKFEGYNGTAWGTVGGGATGGALDDVFYENGKTVTANYTLNSNKNAISAGPITINSGVSVVIPDGSRWVVV
jgi:hypothetical protein